MVRVDGNGAAGSLIQVRGLDKTYRRGNEDIDVLQGLNLDVDKGDFVAFMGPSGSGKTTLLNLLGGLDVPTRGTISVAGDEITHMSRGKLTDWRARHVGFIFQMYNLIPVLNAFPTTTASSTGQGSKAANSSPPMRPERSVIRNVLMTTAANNLRISSPAGWPKRSLIDLKWSRSKISTVTGQPVLASRSIIRDVASAKPRRLSMPVKGSIDAKVRCAVTARSDTSMKMMNTVATA